MNTRLVFTLGLLFTVVAHAAIVEPIEQECVVDQDGHQTCKPSAPIASFVDATSRMRGHGAPCDRQDVVCWCKKALHYTNNLRKTKGLQMLSLGSKKQMKNAMRYADKLSKMGYLKHQNLRSVTKEVGCKRWVGGENLAYNYETRDIAWKCVDQWIRSRGHYENLVRPWYQEMVVGFHFDGDGRVYCVQTFSMYYATHTYGRVNSPNCRPVGSSG